jgi:hypothetical protein
MIGKNVNDQGRPQRDDESGSDFGCSEPSTRETRHHQRSAQPSYDLENEERDVRSRYPLEKACQQ